MKKYLALYCLEIDAKNIDEATKKALNNKPFGVMYYSIKEV